MLKVRRALGAVVTSSLFFVATVEPREAVAQQAWDRVAIEAKSLTDEPLPLRPSWASGVLRVAVTPIPLSAQWRLELDYGKAGRLAIDDATVRPRVIRRDGGQVVFDIPVIPDVLLSARTFPKSMKVLPLEVLAPRAVHGEQLIESSTVVTLSDAPAPHMQAVGSAFARAELLTSAGGILGVCTAFRVAKGMWLTAAHCAYRPADQMDLPPVSQIRLQIDAYAGKVEVVPPLTARVVASGITQASQGLESLMQPSDLDYALLQADEDPDGPAVHLDGIGPVPTDTKLTLYQHWIGDLPPAAGKAYAEGDSCAVFDRLPFPDPGRPELCGIQHGCSSRTGASGGPLIRRGSSELVGLHYGAGLRKKFNCGLAAQAIRGDLCQRAPEVARKAIKCP